MGKLVRGLIVLLAIGGVAAGVYAWSKSRGERSDGVKLVTVETGAITEKAVAVGQIQPRQRFQVKSKIPGIVKRCLVEVGDRVGPGDALFEIVPDPTPLETSEVVRRVEAAEASFARARAELGRMDELSRSGILPANEFEQKRETFELARIALAKARQDRDLTLEGRTSRGQGQESIIRAPAGGTILSRAVNPGDPVVPLTTYQPGTELAAIADMSELVFKGTVDEIDVGKMKEAMPARIKVGALPSDVVTGRVSRIAPQAQQKEGATLFDVEIELEAASGIVLRAGYSANADVIIREKKGVLTLPERLVHFEAGGAESYVEVPGGAPGAPPRKVPVTLGISDGLNVEVVSGLAAGDSVIEPPPKEIS